MQSDAGAEETVKHGHNGGQGVSFSGYLSKGIILAVVRSHGNGNTIVHVVKYVIIL